MWLWQSLILLTLRVKPHKGGGKLKLGFNLLEGGLLHPNRQFSSAAVSSLSSNNTVILKGWRLCRNWCTATCWPLSTSSFMFPWPHLWLNESDWELIFLLRLTLAIHIYWFPFTPIDLLAGWNLISKNKLSFLCLQLSQLIMQFSIFRVTALCPICSKHWDNPLWIVFLFFFNLHLKNSLYQFLPFNLFLFICNFYNYIFYFFTSI